MLLKYEPELVARWKRISQERDRKLAAIEKRMHQASRPITHLAAYVRQPSLGAYTKQRDHAA